MPTNMLAVVVILVMIIPSELSSLIMSLIVVFPISVLAVVVIPVMVIPSELSNLIMSLIVVVPIGVFAFLALILVPVELLTMFRLVPTIMVAVVSLCHTHSNGH
jgi:hypothetical protein